MITIIYILSAVVLLGLCIFVHELGHLLGGMMVGIKARVFSLGYGKGIIKKEWKGTTWQITAIPLGGYCAFYGDDPAAEREGKNYEFLSAAPWRRMVAVVMGPIFNLIFGIILFFIMNLAGYQADTNKVLIPGKMQSGEMISPAFQAGLRDGDQIVEINGTKIENFSGIRGAVVFSEGKDINIKALRNKEELSFTVKPRKFKEKGYFSIGVAPFGDEVVVLNVMDGEVAGKSGLKKLDRIVSVNGVKLKSNIEFNKVIRNNPEKELKLLVKRDSGEKNLSIVIKPKLKKELVFSDVSNEKIDVKLDLVKFKDVSLIEKAIEDGDLKLNGFKVDSYKKFKRLLMLKDGRDVVLETKGGKFKGKIQYVEYGFIGLESVIAPQMVEMKYGLGQAAAKAVTDPFKFIAMNLKGMGMLFSGKLDVRENLSGPVRIAKLAGDTAYYGGLSAFILLMAQISIILMLMNLLPIPAVDGSYLVFYTYETIVRRPINQKVMEKIQVAGFFILITLGVLVIFNDIAKIFF